MGVPASRLNLKGHSKRETILSLWPLQEMVAAGGEGIWRCWGVRNGGSVGSREGRSRIRNRGCTGEMAKIFFPLITMKLASLVEIEAVGM